MAFTEVTITGSFVGPIPSVAAVGEVTFELNSPMSIPGVALIPQKRVTVTLDPTGAIPAGTKLYATDDPGVQPAGVAYIATPRIAGAETEQLYFNLSHVDTTFDLSEATLAAPAAALQAFALDALVVRKANNLADLANVDRARTNLGFGVGPTRLGIPTGAAVLWRDTFDRTDGYLVPSANTFGDLAPSGQRYRTGAGISTARIEHHHYVAGEIGAVPHLSSFIPVIVHEPVRGMYARAKFDQTYGTSGLQRVVFVGNPPAGTRSIAEVIPGNPTLLRTTTPHQLKTGEKITINNVLGTTEINFDDNGGVKYLPTVLDWEWFSIPAASVNAYVSGGTVTTGLANQSLQAHWCPQNVGCFVFDVDQIYIEPIASVRAEFAEFYDPDTKFLRFPEPLREDGTYYEAIFDVDTVAHRATLIVPQLGCVVYEDPRINDIYWGSQPFVQPSVQIDEPVGGGKVMVKEVAAYGPSHDATVPQTVPKQLHLTGDDLTWLSTAAPADWTPGPLFFLCHLKLDAVNTGLVRTILSWWSTGVGKRSFDLGVDAAGKPRITISTDGQNIAGGAAITGPTPLPPSDCWFAISRDDVTGDIDYLLSLDDVDTHDRAITFNSIGTDTSPAGAPYAPRSVGIRLGNKESAATPLAALVDYVELRDGIDGRSVVKVDWRHDEFRGVDDVGNVWQWSALASGYEWIIRRDSVGPDPAVGTIIQATPHLLRLTGDPDTALRTDAPVRASDDLALAFYGDVTALVTAQVQAFISQWTTTTAAQKSFWWGVAANGKLELTVSFDGVNFALAEQSTVICPITSGWFFTTRVAATGLIDFYTSTDPEPTDEDLVVMVRVGATVTGATGVPFASTADIVVGNRDDTTKFPLDGVVHYAAVHDGPGGAILAGVDLRVPFDGTGLAGEAWTLDGTGRRWLVAESNILAGY